MADSFIKQAKQYAEGRPTYPQQLFQFIASNTPSHDLAWDVGTGNGQAAQSLAKLYKSVIATDTSPKQLEFAPKLPNIRYQCTNPNMSMDEVQQEIRPKSSVDLVTIAQAMHWFDLPTFYQQVRWVLKKPHGVIAAWCYTVPEVNPAVDLLFRRYHNVDSAPYWKLARKLVDQKYETIDFPFDPLYGFDHNGPFRFDAEKEMDLEGYLTYLRSWSTYQSAKDMGEELLTDSVVRDFSRAWNEDGQNQKIVTFPVYLRVGKVGSSSQSRS